jgi:hypothetical protein
VELSQSTPIVQETQAKESAAAGLVLSVLNASTKMEELSKSFGLTLEKKQ